MQAWWCVPQRSSLAQCSSRAAVSPKNALSRLKNATHTLCSQYLCGEFRVRQPRADVGRVVRIHYAYTYVDIQILRRNVLFGRGRVDFAERNEGNVSLRYLRNRPALCYREASLRPVKNDRIIINSHIPHACKEQSEEQWHAPGMEYRYARKTHIGSEQWRNNLLEGRLNLSPPMQ